MEIHCVRTTQDGHTITIRTPKQPENRRLIALRRSPSSSTSGSEVSIGRMSRVSKARSSCNTIQHPQADAYDANATLVVPGADEQPSTVTAPGFPTHQFSTSASEHSAEHSISPTPVRPEDEPPSLPMQMMQVAWNKLQLPYADDRHQPLEAGGITELHAENAVKSDPSGTGHKNLVDLAPGAVSAMKSQSAHEVHDVSEEREEAGHSFQHGQASAAEVPTASPHISDVMRPDSIAEGEALAQEGDKYVLYTPSPCKEYADARSEPWSTQSQERPSSLPQVVGESRSEQSEGQLPKLKPYHPVYPPEELSSEQQESLLARYMAYSPKARGGEGPVTRPSRPRQNS